MMNSILVTISVIVASVMFTLVIVAMYYNYIFSRYIKEKDNENK